MAPSIMIHKIDEEILDKTPTMRRVPPIVSAKAIGICISTGNPILVRKPAKPGLNFPDPWTMKITPIAALIPKCVMSCSLFSRIFASANVAAPFQ